MDNKTTSNSCNVGGLDNEHSALCLNRMGRTDHSCKKINTKPKCQLTGQDGNVFNLIGLASKALKRAGMQAEASEMSNRCFNAGSYSEALQVISSYVEVS